MGEKTETRAQRVNAATRPLISGAFGVTCGIASSLLGAELAGATLTLAGLGLLAWGLHRLGRLGSDPPGAS
ncbi:MAG TPA: hypothetical protein VNN80_35975 [Polyangiaceae bacterium]|nr:hypothetical protein [Polyangiaceae bacterium]